MKISKIVPIDFFSSSNELLKNAIIKIIDSTDLPGVALLSY